MKQKVCVFLNTCVSLQFAFQCLTSQSVSQHKNQLCFRILHVEENYTVVASAIGVILVTLRPSQGGNVEFLTIKRSTTISNWSFVWQPTFQYISIIVTDPLLQADPVDKTKLTFQAELVLFITSLSFKFSIMSSSHPLAVYLYTNICIHFKAQVMIRHVSPHVYRVITFEPIEILTRCIRFFDFKLYPLSDQQIKKTFLMTFTENGFLK